MAVNLNDVKHELNRIHKEEDKTLASLQRYFEKSSRSHKATKHITFTTSLNVGGYNGVLSEEGVDLTPNNQIVREWNNKRATRHSHDISWDDIERAYKLQEAIHAMLAFEYEKYDKGYKGRRLFQQGDFTFGFDAAGRPIVKGKGSELSVGGTVGFGYGHTVKFDKNGNIVKVGNYGKLNDELVKIHQDVLYRIYDRVWKETNKHLLDKFNTISLDGSDDFEKMIKVTQELAYDLRKSKAWKKEVEDLVRKAKINYKAKMKQEKMAINKIQKQQLKNQHVVSIRELEAIGRAILGLAVEYCPIETGFLRSSGRLYVSNNDIRIIFECPYAAYVHDNVNARHPIGRDHFLSEAAQEILPDIPVWTEATGDDSFILGSYMSQTWDRDRGGNIISDMYWREHKGYRAVYMDIDTDLKINYAHYK